MTFGCLVLICPGGVSYHVTSWMGTRLELGFDYCPYRPHAAREQEDESVEPQENGDGKEGDVRQC